MENKQIYNDTLLSYYDPDYLMHHGIKGQKWGVRRYQNEDGSLTAAGVKRYGTVENFNKAREYQKGLRRSTLEGGLIGRTMYKRSHEAPEINRSSDGPSRKERRETRKAMRKDRNAAVSQKTKELTKQYQNEIDRLEGKKARIDKRLWNYNERDKMADGTYRQKGLFRNEDVDKYNRAQMKINQIENKIENDSWEHAKNTLVKKYGQSSYEDLVKSDQRRLGAALLTTMGVSIAAGVGAYDLTKKL